MPTEKFKSPEAYRKYRAYVHLHGIPTHAKDVVVAGKKHKVKHRAKKVTKNEGKIPARKGSKKKHATRKSL